MVGAGDHDHAFVALQCHVVAHHRDLPVQALPGQRHVESLAGVDTALFGRQLGEAHGQPGTLETLGVVDPGQIPGQFLIEPQQTRIGKGLLGLAEPRQASEDLGVQHGHPVENLPLHMVQPGRGRELDPVVLDLALPKAGEGVGDGGAVIGLVRVLQHRHRGAVDAHGIAQLGQRIDQGLRFARPCPLLG